MDGMVLTIFLLASFLGGLTSGLAGFAMGLVVSGFYLHILTPIQTATLIVGYGFVTQGYGVWALRHSVRWRSAAPFMAGGVIGVPAGTMLLTYVDAAIMRVTVGALLAVYSIYSLTRPTIKLTHEGIPTEVGVGFLNGLLAGLTGLVGIVVVIWCQLRNWPKDVQRTIFQPVLLATIAPDQQRAGQRALLGDLLRDCDPERDLLPGEPSDLMIDTPYLDEASLLNLFDERPIWQTPDLMARCRAFAAAAMAGDEVFHVMMAEQADDL